MSVFSTGKNISLVAIDVQIFSRMRVILAFAALLIVWTDPAYYERALTWVAFILFNLYALALYYFKPRIRSIDIAGYTRWLDVCWCVILLVAGGGADSIFVFLFMLPILGSSFRFGYEEGLRVTVISVLIFLIVGLIDLKPGATLDTDRFLVRVVILAAFGYIFAYLGGTELMNKARLALLRDINKLANPRFGVDQTLGFLLKKILNFFEADSAYLIIADPDGSGYFLRHCDRSSPDGALRVEVIDDEHSLLRWIKPATGVCYQAAGHLFGKRVYFGSGQDDALSDNNVELIADILNVSSYVSVPFLRRENAAGRIYLTSIVNTLKGLTRNSCTRSFSRRHRSLRTYIWLTASRPKPPSASGKRSHATFTTRPSSRTSASSLALKPYR